jgi:geranylgeranyl pyrophosphate synthase
MTVQFQRSATISELNSITTKPAITIDSDWSQPILTELAAAEARMREIPAGHHEMLTSAIQSLYDSGGKRVRPALTLLTAGVFNAQVAHAIAVAAAVEMLHTATLVHDDMIDGALLRRGAPTLNAIWSADVSVLVGDYLFARGANLIAEVESVRVMDLFANTLGVILNGELTQKFSKWRINRDEYAQRIYAKTAALFVLCTQSSAILGRASDHDYNALTVYGRQVGMAFQIIDDVLDFVSTSEQMGKPVGGDLRQGIFTLPAIFYSEKYPQDVDLLFVLENQNGDSDRSQRVIEKIQQSDSIELAMQEARRLAEEGMEAINHFAPSEYKDGLMAIAERVVNRKM